MTEHQIKEFVKWCLDNGQRKLTREEKEEIKFAIDQADIKKLTKNAPTVKEMFDELKKEM